MAENDSTTQDNDVNLSDIISEQSKTIDTLVKELKTSSSPSDQQPIYWTSPSTTEEEPPNYVLFILIGIGLFLILKKRGRK